ncbi:MAG: protein kinase [Desulfomonilaceae bacterium]|nr:protein kinase [Desulfomonilaceae bacterium]
MNNQDHEAVKKRFSKSDYEFLTHTRLFDVMPEEAKFRLAAAMKPVHVGKGERFISQGEEGDCLYVIQSGDCMVQLEKEGTIHHIAALGPGNIVGEMALLTGEKRNAHVCAGNDADLWKLETAEFDQISDKYPEIRNFLTQLVSERFARAVLTADRTIGKYVITEVIGRGGWSVVYKGEHTTLNMPVAIKMLKHHMAMDQDFLVKFRNEAQTIAKLNHENIVKVYDIEQLFRTVFIIMEHLEGLSVEGMFANTPLLPADKVVEILLQTCEGLGYAHDRGIVHGDVKPGNIFIQRNNKVKLLDFGVACATGSKSEKIMGTPKYFSPEQIRLRPIDRRSDVYSLGLTAFRMLTGREAFLQPDVASLCRMHLYENIPDPKTLVPDLPEELNRVILKAVRKDPLDRYQSVREMIHDIEPLAEKFGVSVSREPNRHTNMMGLFLFYRDEHRGIIRRLVQDFSQELRKVGADLRDADFKDV